MGYADLISSKVARLPVDRQAEVLRYIEPLKASLPPVANTRPARPTPSYNGPGAPGDV
jgi:hypothetical protein